MWIELDGSSGVHRAVPEPALFLELATGYAAPEYVAECAVPLLLGFTPRAPLVQNLLHCLQGLPQEAFLVHTGYFPGREKGRIRVTIAFPHMDDVIAYLPDSAGIHLLPHVKTVMKEQALMYDYPVLHLDIGDRICDRFGIEFRFHEHEKNPGFQERWEPVLSYLTARCALSDVSAQKLRDFPGICRVMDSQSLEPRWYRRFIYYTKAVFDSRGNQRYKVYCAYEKQTASV